MPTTTLTFSSSGETVGLVVRGKNSPSHEPGVMEQHADCILADGSPIGFFGDVGAGPASGGSAGSGPSVGLNMKGVVYDYPLFKIHRPYYIDLAEAKKYLVKSTVLLITVTKTQASLFKDYWDRLKTKPDSFYLLGYNCSTRASDAFIYAGILTGGIPGLDTPNNLYKQLITSFTKTASYSGFVGFVAKSGGGYDVLVET